MLGPIEVPVAGVHVSRKRADWPKSNGPAASISNSSSLGEGIGGPYPGAAMRSAPSPGLDLLEGFDKFDQFDRFEKEDSSWGQHRSAACRCRAPASWLAAIPRSGCPPRTSSGPERSMP